MKRSALYKNIAAIILVLACGLFTSASAKKAKLRLSADYVKVMDESSVVKIQTKAKGEHGMQSVENVEIKVYREFEDTNFLITTVTTDADGIALFDVSMDKTSYNDTMAEITYTFKAKGGDWYTKSSKTITYIDSKLDVKLVTKDSTVYIVAKLTNAMTGEPISEEGIKVRVKRLFTPLIIGKDLHYTNEDGMIRVAYTDDIPGKNNVLDFEIVLFESDAYGTVKNVLRTNLGAPVHMESTFNQRTMWSPPSKTPYWLLIFPNLIIFGIWFTIIRLVYNLFKISNS